VSGLSYFNLSGEGPELFRPGGVGTADKQRSLERALHHRDPLEAIFECTHVKEQFGPTASRAVAPHCAQFAVEQ